jgi:DNA repair protein REV1
MDSIGAGKLLNWVDYRLIDPNQTNSVIPATIENRVEKTQLTSTIKLSDISKEPVKANQALLPPSEPQPQPVQSENKADGALNCNNPQFLKNYYANSRLHHLSAWRVKFQEALAKELGDARYESKSNHFTEGNSEEKGDPITFHVDMDCFFASVSVRFHPELASLPVAVSHSNNPQGTADVAACNYIARSFGIRNGMWISNAMELCPDLRVVGYEFEHYESVSRTVFSILTRYSREVSVMSCDEAFITVHTLDPVGLANNIRADIEKETQCTASIGIGENKLLAKIATKKAKPNGTFHLTLDMLPSFFSTLPVRELPSVGRKVESKLREHNIITVSKYITRILGSFK